MSEARRQRLSDSPRQLTSAELFEDGSPAAGLGPEVSVTLDWKQRSLTLRRGKKSVELNLDHTGAIQQVRGDPHRIEDPSRPLTNVPYFRAAQALNAAQRRYSNAWDELFIMSDERGERGAGPEVAITDQERVAVDELLEAAEGVLEARGTSYKREGSLLIISHAPSDKSVYARFAAPLRAEEVHVGIDPSAVLLYGANAAFTISTKNYAPLGSPGGVNSRSPSATPTFLALPLEAILTGSYDVGAHHELGHARLYLGRLKGKASAFEGKIHFLNQTSNAIPGAEAARVYGEYAPLDEPLQRARELQCILSLMRHEAASAKLVCSQAVDALDDLVHLSERQATAFSRAARSSREAEIAGGIDWHLEVPGAQLRLPILRGLEDGRHLRRMIAWRASLYSEVARFGRHLQSTLERTRSDETELRTLRLEVLALNRFIARSEKAYEGAVERCREGRRWKPQRISKLSRRYAPPGLERSHPRMDARSLASAAHRKVQDISRAVRALLNRIGAWRRSAPQSAS
jgi:hypothetical protein